MKKEFITLISDGIVYVKELSSNGTEIKTMDQLRYSYNCIFITVQIDELIANISDDIIRNNDIIDLECLDKQIRQSSDLSPLAGKWSLQNMLSTYLEMNADDLSLEEYPILIERIAHCYQVMKDLIDDNEWKRISDIELPVNRIIYTAQKRGIHINFDRIKSICEQLHQEVYSLKNQIQLKLEVMDDDIEGYMHKKGIRCCNPSNTEIEYWSRMYPELEMFLSVKKKEANLDILLMLASTNSGINKCYPIFKGFSSSTGRIYLREPALQNLNRQLRYLLKNSVLTSGSRYTYIDFGQFEAGILAGLSDNKSFRELYENDMIYETLAKFTRGTRDSAKIDFYRFVYGGNVSKEAEPFFERYGLKKQVKKLRDKAIKDGYIDSLFANRRCIAKDEKDLNWIVNHYIQSTSSLIFKQAMINVDAAFGNKVRLVMPMHDAALYIVSDQIKTDQIIEEFKKAFNKWIPIVKPVVKEKNFFEDEDDT